MTKVIYALCEPGTRKIRYIGQTVNPKRRLTSHISDAKIYDSHLARWIRRVLASGLRPNMVVLYCVKEEESWAEEETRYIRVARSLGLALVNGNDGGEGGICPTPETLERMRDCKLGEKNPNFGKTTPQETKDKRKKSMAGWGHSEQTKEQMSLSKLGDKNPNFGRPMPEEQKIQISAKLKGRIFSEEHRKNLRQPKSLEQRAAMSVAQTIRRMKETQ